MTLPPPTGYVVTMTPPAPTLPRNRIVEVRDIPGSLILPNPSNWRTHPDSQKSALSAVFRDVGVVDVLKVVPHPTETGAFMLVDGHARHELLGPEGMIRCAVLDLTPDEQRLILATFDPLTQMSGTDRGLLDSLLAGLSSEDAALSALLEGMWSFDMREQMDAAGGAVEPVKRNKKSRSGAQPEVGGGVFGDAPLKAEQQGRCPTCGHVLEEERTDEY